MFYFSKPFICRNKLSRWTNQKKLINQIHFSPPNVSIRNINSFFQLLVKQSINKISQVLGISKKSLAKLFPAFLSDQDRLKLQNTRKVDANIWWGILEWPLLFSSLGSDRLLTLKNLRGGGSKGPPSVFFWITREREKFFKKILAIFRLWH